MDSRLRGNDGIVIFTIISARVLSANAFAEKMQKGRLKPYSQASDDLCSIRPTTQPPLSSTPARHMPSGAVGAAGGRGAGW